jgi:DNA polymerase-1
VDYSQAELRIAAALSGEPFLLKVYEDGRDLHNEVALAMFGPEFTKEQRVYCKMFNFSYLYGGTEYSFAQDAGLPIEVARDFVHKYNETMPVLATWKKNNIALMTAQHFIRYRMGLMRRIPFICNTNKKDVEHTAINAEVQGSASQMTSLSAIRSRPLIRPSDAVILMLVHDSIIFESPLGNESYVGNIIRETMESTAAEWFPEVRWKADIEVGERWGSLKPLPLLPLRTA